MVDYSNVLGNKPKPWRMQVYPALDHFHRASQSGWMRPFDLAEYEAYRNAESEWPARSFVSAGMREDWDDTSEEANAGEDRELAAAD